MLHAARQRRPWLIFDVRQKMKAVAIIGLFLLVSGCATRVVSITGVCRDYAGTPKKGVAVVGSEIRGSLAALIVPVLPEIRPLASATSDEAGMFSLQLRSRRGLLLDIRNTQEKRPFIFGTRIMLPEESRDELSFFLLLVVAPDGGISSEWKKPNKAPEPTPGSVTPRAIQGSST
jgi:hypothetical protein